MPRLDLALSAARRQAGASAVLPLDLTPAFAAFSLRRLARLQVGPLIRVRRAADNAEMDISAGTDGWLDTAALLAFAAGGSAYGVVWYDQSENARHVAQATAASQPRLVTAGALETTPNGRPCLRAVSGTRGFTSGAAPWPSGALSAQIVASVDVQAGFPRLLNIGSDTASDGVIYCPLIQTDAANGWVAGDALLSGSGYQAGNTPRLVAQAPGLADGLMHQHDLRLSAAGVHLHIDGAAVTPRSAVAGAVDGGTVFRVGDSVAVAPAYGRLCEFLIENTDMAATTRSTILAGQRAAWGTP